MLPQTFSPPPRHFPFDTGFFWRVSVWSLVFLLAWDASGLDRPMAHWFGSAAGFALREDWFLTSVMHDAAQRIGWIGWAVLVLMVFWPLGVMRRLERGERAGIATGALLALLAITVLKNASRTSCPWDLAEFGGAESYVSHWALGVWDGGTGHCFPGGHASTGFAWLAGYFGLRRNAPRAARLWLAAALLAGFTLGLVQQARGAHFMSHNLWTAWICWTVTGLAEAARQRFWPHRATGVEGLAGT